jgi:glycine cleavage system H protein
MSETRYTTTHEWVRLEGNVATVGITDHAQQALGDLVYVELPAPGRDLVAGEVCAVVESVKAASDVYAPLAGRVLECNQALADNPALANADPAGKGWFFRMQPADVESFRNLLDEAAYAAETEHG